jgi:processive 1,2-diacylglycerol beta-glucosyltransferase
MKKKPRVVFTFVEAGMGHIVPATGIADAFEKKYGDKCEVVRTKIFSDSKNPKIVEYQQKLIDDVKHLARSQTYAFLEYYLGEMVGSKRALDFLDFLFRNVKQEIIEEIVELKPDLIFSSYYSPTHFACEARERKMMDCLIATYSPDPVVYPAWDTRGDLFLTINSQAYECALKKDFPEKTIKTIPFIYRKEISEINVPKSEMKEKLGLDKDKFTILLADGAYGQKNLVAFTKILAQLDANINVVAVCGKNEEAYKKLKNFDKVNKKVNLIVLGFVKNIFDYLYVSDLFVGKGGGNSIPEALYFGVPVIVSSFANVLEEKTADFYINKKDCGMIIRDKGKFKKTINKILKDPTCLDKYRENSKVFHDSTGAEKGADEIFNLLKTKFTDL